MLICLMFSVMNIIFGVVLLKIKIQINPKILSEFGPNTQEYLKNSEKTYKYINQVFGLFFLSLGLFTLILAIISLLV